MTTQHIITIVVALLLIIGVAIGIGTTINTKLGQHSDNFRASFENTHNGTIITTWHTPHDNIVNIIWADNQDNEYLTICEMKASEFLPRTIIREHTIVIDKGGQQ